MNVPVQQKRAYDSITEAPQKPVSKRSKQDTTICELCNHDFMSVTTLRHHIESVHMRTSMWSCSECKKLFTSKSNLKVHLRVHTKIKPYHCKSCTYSCMHHSSIKEHLTRQHPGVVHSSSNPAYVFNTSAVPDPEQFNNKNFDRAAFIEIAKESNTRLVAKINENQSASARLSNSVNISPISSSSTSSSFYRNDETSFINEHSQSMSSNDSFNTPADVKPVIKAKYSNFSIDSLLNEPAVPIKSEPIESLQFNTQSSPTYIQQYNYNQQLQLYFKYLVQLQLNRK